MIGVNPGGLFGGDTEQIMRNFREQTGVTFPIGWATDSSYSQYRGGGGGGISPFPLDVIIDQAGNVAYINAEYEPGTMQTVVQSLLGQ